MFCPFLDFTSIARMRIIACCATLAETRAGPPWNSLVAPSTVLTPSEHPTQLSTRSTGLKREDTDRRAACEPRRRWGRASGTQGGRLTSPRSVLWWPACQLVLRPVWSTCKGNGASTTLATAAAAQHPSSWLSPCGSAMVQGMWAGLTLPVTPRVAACCSLLLPSHLNSYIAATNQSSAVALAVNHATAA